MTRHGQPIVGGHMPSTGVVTAPRIEHDATCTGCGRLSYTSGTGAAVNPLVGGQCPECREGWPCSSCGERYAFDDLSLDNECGRCFVARMGKEAA